MMTARERALCLPEIVGVICSWVEEWNDILACTLVNRLWHELATAQLWTGLSGLKIKWQAAAELDRLSQLHGPRHPDVVARARALRGYAGEAREWYEDDDDEWRLNVDHNLLDSEVAESLKNLEIVSLRCYVSATESDEIKLLSPSVRILVACLYQPQIVSLPSRCPNLRMLSLLFRPQDVLDGLTVADSLKRLPHLTHLCFLGYDISGNAALNFLLTDIALRRSPLEHFSFDWHWHDEWAAPVPGYVSSDSVAPLTAGEGGPLAASEGSVSALKSLGIRVTSQSLSFAAIVKTLLTSAGANLRRLAIDHCHTYHESVYDAHHSAAWADLRAGLLACPLLEEVFIPDFAYGWHHGMTRFEHEKSEEDDGGMELVQRRLANLARATPRMRRFECVEYEVPYRPRLTYQNSHSGSLLAVSRYWPLMEIFALSRIIQIPLHVEDLEQLSSDWPRLHSLELPGSEFDVSAQKQPLPPGACMPRLKHLWLYGTTRTVWPGLSQRPMRCSSDGDEKPCPFAAIVAHAFPSIAYIWLFAYVHHLCEPCESLKDARKIFLAKNASKRKGNRWNHLFYRPNPEAIDPLWRWNKYPP